MKPIPIRVLLVALSALAILLSATRPQPAFAEGSDQGYFTEVRDNGRLLMVVGFITQEVAQAIKNAPSSLESVEIESLGGDIFAAMEIAREIRARGLEVRTHTTCWSACTLIFQSGVRRIAEQGSSFMYHRVQFGGDAAKRAEYQREFSAAYREHGLPRAFIAKIEQSKRDLYLQARELPAGIVTEFFKE